MKLFYNHQTVRNLMCIILCCCATFVFGQNIFWSEDFQGGQIPNDWGNDEVTSPFIKWTWENDATIGLVSGQPFFASNTVNNGFVIFNSDALGSNFTHDTRLTTSAIDCSNQSSVWIHFENQFAYFSNLSVPLLGISTDSINWTYDTLFTNLGSNVTNIPLQPIEKDISNIAANQSTVYLQFRWKGRDEYVWRLDDIRLQDGATPPPNHDLTIEAFAIPPNHATPFEHRKPIEFGALIRNNGLVDASNVKLYMTVRDTVNNTVFYKDSASIASISAGNNAVLGSANLFLPPQIGLYELEYFVTQDSVDANRIDNSKLNYFIVNDTLFSKDNNTGFGSARPSIPPTQGYMIGNIYQIQSSGYYSDEIIFNCGHPSFLPLNGFSVTAFLYEIDSTVLPDFSNFNDNNATQVGFGQYNFSSSSQSFSFFNTPIRDINGDKVPLKAGRFYFVMLSFTGAASVLNIGVSDALSYSTDYATILSFNNSFNLNGFGPDLTAVVRWTITTVSAEKEVTQPFEGQVKVFPNPTSDWFNTEIELDHSYPTHANISIVDILGNVIYSVSTEIHGKEIIPIDVNEWSSGVYFMNIQTKKGQITKRIVVQ